MRVRVFARKQPTKRSCTFAISSPLGARSAWSRQRRVELGAADWDGDDEEEEARAESGTRQDDEDEHEREDEIEPRPRTKTKRGKRKRGERNPAGDCDRSPTYFGQQRNSSM